MVKFHAGTALAALLSCLPAPMSHAPMRQSDVEAALGGCGIPHRGVHAVDLPTRRMVVVAFDADDPKRPTNPWQLEGCDALGAMFVGGDGSGSVWKPDDCVVVCALGRFSEDDPASIEAQVDWLDAFAAALYSTVACQERKEDDP